MLHQRQLWWSDAPAQRRPAQRYIQFMFESPVGGDQESLASMAGYFNWSISYRNSEKIK